MPVYLDHSATTRPWDAVVECLSEQLLENYANPASLHRLGQAAEKSLNQSHQRIADCLGCHKDELLLTSGGSESINLAIKGFTAANPRLGKRIITSRGEHAATAETLKYLSQQGFQIEAIPLLPNGQIDLEAFAAALQEPAALISLIHVSNETGAVNPVPEIVRLRNQYQPSAAIHLDGVQSLGRLPVHFKKMGIDLLSGSGHKVGAPKGIGWLVVRKGIRLTPMIHGGGQQQGLRAGTENPPMAAALAKAVELTTENLSQKVAAVTELNQLLYRELSASGVEFARISSEEAVPHIIAIAFPGLRGETMLHALEASEIYVSTGSACSSKKQKKNLVLQAMGVPEHIAECAIRISMSPGNSADEIRQTVRVIQESCRLLIHKKSRL